MKPTGEKYIFDQVHNRQNGRCYITKEVLLKSEVLAWNFAHVLPKGMYPEFRLMPENIIMTVKEFHTDYDNKTIEYLYKKWDTERVEMFLNIKAALISLYTLHYRG